MTKDELTIFTQVVNALLNADNQLLTNYQQAIERGHHWPNERVNMSSASRLETKKALDAAAKLLATS